MMRFTVGRTRSGKTVTSHTDLDQLSTSEEIFDALAMLAFVAIREFRRDMHSDLSIHLALEIQRLECLFENSKEWHLQMQRLGAKTSIDIVNHAIRLLSPEFRE
jgi:hypothetical protein